VRRASSLVPAVTQQQLGAGATRAVQNEVPETCLPTLWSARAAAARWHLSRQYLYKLHTSGRLRAFRFPSSSPNGRGALRFAEEDLLALLKEE
jgi:hypothetical protein